MAELNKTYRHEAERISLSGEDGRELAYVEFPEEEKGTVNVLHTVVDPSLKGQGIAGQLMEELTGDLRKDGRKAVLTCSYAVRWFEKHPECGDVLKK